MQLGIAIFFSLVWKTRGYFTEAIMQSRSGLKDTQRSAEQYLPLAGQCVKLKQALIFDRNIENLISHPYVIHDILIAFGNHLAKYGMLVIQPGGRLVGDKELAAVRARTGVGHG